MKNNKKKIGNMEDVLQNNTLFCALYGENESKTKKIACLKTRN